MSTAVTPARVINDRAAPAAGTYQIDPAHSSVEAVARHLMVSKVRGRFRSLGGSVTISEDPTASRVEVAIDAASIDTGDDKRDQHLRSPDFLDVENHPKITFNSSVVRPAGDHWEIVGELAIRGISREVTLNTQYLGTLVDPFGNEKALFSATTELERENWGISWNQALETGGVLVGRTLKVELEIQTVKEA